MNESERKNLKIVLIGFTVACLLCTGLFFTCIGPNSLVGRLFGEWMFPGDITSDIADYPRMRAYMVMRYPSAPDFLLPSIPDDATVVEFLASDMEALQASGALRLIIQLNDTDTQAELNRLRTLAQDQEIDEENYFPFVDAYPMLRAIASYDPDTNTFEYEISSD